MPVDDDVLAILHPSEELKVVLEAVLVPVDKTNEDTGGPDPRNDALNRRVLAVVSHKEEWELSEEGSLFVCKYKRNAHDDSEHLEVQRIYPIYGNFAITMTQMRRQTLDLRPNTAMSVLDQPRSGFSISIIPGDASSDSSSDSSGSSSASSSSYRGFKRPTFYTHDVQNLRRLVTECKRLKEASDIDASETTTNHLAQSTHHFSWLRVYINRKSLFSFAATNPPDIRLSNKPIIERLSASSAGLTEEDNFDIDAIRDQWLRSRARDETRKGKKRLRIRVGTFNVNGKLPSQDLSAWIQGTLSTMKKAEAELGRPPSIPPMDTISPLSNILKNPFESWISTKTPLQDAPKLKELVPEPLDTSSDPDLFVLAFQEVDLSTEALIYSTSTVREDAWYTAVFAALGEKGALYEKLASKQLVGMLIILVVKKSLKECFGDVRTSVAGAGLLGVMGNKGGVAMRVTFTPPAPPQPDSEKSTDEDKKSDTSSEKPTSTSFHPGPTTLTFVNSHLAAFDEMFERRNADYHDLSRRLIFEASEEQKRQKRIEKGVSDYYDEEDAELIQGGVGVFETDAVFWMGDLNYRLDLADADIRSVLADGDWDGKYDTLLRFDQLRKAMKDNKAFSGFREFPISHAPSYRFSPGILTDKLGYDVKRKPAWTDRILNMSSATCQVLQRTYSSHPQITMSDHRPVAADFDVDVDYYDKDFHEAVVQKLYRLVGHMEDAHAGPVVKVDTTSIDFGKLIYGRPISREVKIENAGKTPCVFRFVPTDAGSPIHPEWLRNVAPLAGLLLPGEAAVITLSVLIDNPLAAILNASPKNLSSILVLHVAAGKDQFISISGEYQYTCFANKLSTLTRLPGPIRSLTSPTELRAKNRPISASREVMRLVNWLMSTSGNMDDLFLKGADENMVDTIRECLDTGADFPYDPHSADHSEVSLAFAVTLLRLLDSLVDPIIPPSLHSNCLQMSNRDEALEILGVLPPTSVNVWISVSAFLHYICQTSKDGEHAQKLARVFAPVIMRDSTDSTTTLPASPAGKRKFIQFFLN